MPTPRGLLSNGTNLVPLGGVPVAQAAGERSGLCPWRRSSASTSKLIGAVEVDVVMLRGREVAGGLIVHRVAVGAYRVEGVAHVGRGPQHRRVGDQGEAQCLVDLVIEVAASDVALVGEEQVTAQRVQALAFVQLPPESAAEFFVSNVSAEVPSPRMTAVTLQLFVSAPHA